MRTATDTDLISFGDWTLRVRGSQSPNPRLVVLLHGWTGDENSMWIFTRGLSPDYWMIAPRAPYSADPNGFSWRPLQPGTFGTPSFEALAPSAEALIRLIDEYSASVKLEAQQFDLMGFSQGAAMVNTIGLLYPRRVDKMGVLAGFLRENGLLQEADQELSLALQLAEDADLEGQLIGERLPVDAADIVSFEAV